MMNAVSGMSASKKASMARDTMVRKMWAPWKHLTLPSKNHGCTEDNSTDLTMSVEEKYGI